MLNLAYSYILDNLKMITKVRDKTNCKKNYDLSILNLYLSLLCQLVYFLCNQ